ncbi:hypothetical protein OSB04_024034 [Centaurea solstitialis]|uniref:Uncharacterized protein n=1 Tax=Centaurea solstitialis TaxID=347529 RepID=A0AA38W088_9ASTR|nr:hypothetical protein OSB04_024034 [Centaurea solstitialis]
MIDPKIETTLTARNLEAKRAVLVVTEFIAEKIQEVENVYKEYTVEIFEVKFRINLISSSMKEINVLIDMDWSIVYGERECTKTVLCSVAMMRRYLSLGWTGNLAYALDDQLRGSIGVSESPDVFSGDLSGFRPIGMSRLGFT